MGCSRRRAAGALVGWAASPSGSAVDPVCENQAGWKDPVSADGTGCEVAFMGGTLVFLQYALFR